MDWMDWIPEGLNNKSTYGAKNHHFRPIFWSIFDRFSTIFVKNFNRFCARARVYAPILFYFLPCFFCLLCAYTLCLPHRFRIIAYAHQSAHFRMSRIRMHIPRIDAVAPFRHRAIHSPIWRGRQKCAAAQIQTDGRMLTKLFAHVLDTQIQLLDQNFPHFPHRNPLKKGSLSENATKRRRRRRRRQRQKINRRASRCGDL